MILVRNSVFLNARNIFDTLTLSLSQETGKKLHVSKMPEKLHDTLNFSQRNRKETSYFLRC